MNIFPWQGNSKNKTRKRRFYMPRAKFAAIQYLIGLQHIIQIYGKRFRLNRQTVNRL